MSYKRESAVERESAEKREAGIRQSYEKRVLTYLAKYLNILGHLSLDTLPFMFRYFFETFSMQKSEDLRPF